MDHSANDKPGASDADVARCWDANAPVWARHVRAGYDVHRRLYHGPAFLECVGNLAGLEVLDAGCGEGVNARELARRGARVTGVDVSPKMVELARDEEARAPLGIRYELASMSDLQPFGEAAFDAVVSFMALHDCADYEGAVREFCRVLRPGGLLAYVICHPCFTYGFPVWDRNARGEVIGVRLGDYFEEGSCVERWRFHAAADAAQVEPFTVIYFNRRLSDYLNPLCATGFRLEGVAEPRATEEACAADPDFRKHRLVPHVLLLKARKPA
jgi:SAM-dependent methyltransferase